MKIKTRYVIIYFILIHFLLFFTLKGTLKKRPITTSRQDTIYISIKPIKHPPISASGEVKLPFFATIEMPKYIKADTTAINFLPQETKITAISFRKNDLKVQYWHKNVFYEAFYPKIYSDFTITIDNNGNIKVSSNKNKIILPQIWLFCSVNMNLNPEFGVLITYKRLGISLSTPIPPQNNDQKYRIGLYFKLW